LEQADRQGNRQDDEMIKNVYQITYMLNDRRAKVKESIAVDDFWHAHEYAHGRIGSQWAMMSTLDAIEAIKHLGKVEVPE
jgi:hypothetical protein